METVSVAPRNVSFIALRIPRDFREFVGLFGECPRIREVGGTGVKMPALLPKGGKGYGFTTNFYGAPHSSLHHQSIARADCAGSRNHASSGRRDSREGNLRERQEQLSE